MPGVYVAADSWGMDVMAVVTMAKEWNNRARLGIPSVMNSPGAQTERFSRGENNGNRHTENGKTLA